MDTNTRRGTAELALSQMRTYLANAKRHDGNRHQTDLSPESWANWLLHSARNGLNSCNALRSYLAPHLTVDEIAEVASAHQALAHFKSEAVEAGAHLLPGDLPQSEA